MNKQDLIQKLKQLDGLTAEERATLIDLINTKKKYGLVWEDKPEKVEEQLRQNLPVLNEVKEKRILAKYLHQREKKTNGLFDTTESNAAIPAPNHILIEGDNLHALTALSFTHKGKIDVIYIDPPYNTGNKDFKYNDSFVDKEDSYRHSKWLSFMQKRLKIAKTLLKNEGVIFVSIDDNEQAQLKSLLDEEFNEKNFISNIIWAAGKKNDSKYVSNSHEYILAYFKDIDQIKTNKTVWRERKEGIDRIYKMAAALVKKNNGDFDASTNDLKKWFKDLADNDPSKEHSHYSVIDERGVYFPDNISWPGGGGPKYEILHPITNKPVAVPSRGWVYSTRERMQEIINAGNVSFGKDENVVPTLKSYLKNREFQVPYSVIYKDGRAATKRLREIFGFDPFENPKDEIVIGKLIKIATHKNSIVLDFFAGSGTTLHAIMQLNSEDDGNRQCILVTNNENNICEEVTYERNKRIIKGYKSPKDVTIAGLTNNNLRYYKCEFVSSTKTEANKRLLTQASTELLQIKENCYIDITEANGFNPIQCRIFADETEKYMIVVYHSRSQNAVCEQLIAYINTLAVEQRIKLYAFSPEKETLAADFADVADKIDALPLPDAIYSAYRATFRMLRLDRKLINPAEALELANAPELFDTPTEA